MATSRRWLVISFLTGIEASAASHHIDDRLRALRKMGIEPVVVSNICTPAAGEYTKVRTPCLSPSGLRFEARNLMKRLMPDAHKRRIAQAPLITPILPAHLLESLLLRRDASWSWYVTAAQAAERCARSSGVELIYSTGGPPSAHIAASRCARSTGLPWIAEFQDPVVMPGRQKPGDRRFNAEIERMVARDARAAVFLTSGARERMAGRVPLGDRGFVIWPGADAGLFAGMDQGRPPDGKLLIGHFGSLVMGRSLSPMLDALREMIRHHPEAREKVCVLQMGAVDGRERERLAVFGRSMSVDVRPLASRRDTLAAMRRCDLLLIAQHDGPISAETIPSKTYEYLLSGVPVLGLTRRNPALMTLLCTYGHFAADIGDPLSVRDVLSRIYTGWMSTGKAPAQMTPSPYTTARAAGELVALASRAVEMDREGQRIA